MVQSRSLRDQMRNLKEVLREYIEQNKFQYIQSSITKVKRRWRRKIEKN